MTTALSVETQPDSRVVDVQPRGANLRRILVRAGPGRRTVDRALRDVRLVQPMRGVVVGAGRFDDPATRAAAVALVLPPDAAVSGRTAAWIHGVDARAPDERAECLDLVCCVPSPRTPVRRPGLTCVQAHLDARDVVEVDGVPVTSPGRTALDLARTEPPHMALACLDALTRRHRLDPRDLLDQLARFAGGRGVVQARRMLGFCDPGAESFGESWTRLRILDAGFPRPETQVVIDRGPGLAPYRLDMGWRRRRIAVEYDGEEFHSAPEQRRHDAVRRAWIERDCGWRVVPVTKGDVLGRQPRLEQGLAEILGIAPLTRRRAW